MMKTLLPWLLVVGLGVGLGALFMSHQQQTIELTQLRAESQELQAMRAAADEARTNLVQTENAELVKLRKDNEDLLRLRNQVRQLLDEKQQLSKQAQTAQAQAQAAQAQAQNFQAQAQSAQAQAQSAQAQAQAAALRLNATQNQAAPDKAAACMNNLRQIDGAKQQWALEKQKTAEAVPAPADLAPYFKNNAMPVCPAGGVYSFNAVGAEPTCNIPGHALPK
jgi:glucose repression mediator protein